MVHHDLPKSPALKASCLSRAYFWWLSALFWEGYKRDLQTNDLYEALPEDQSANLGNILAAEWEKELVRCRKKDEIAQGKIQRLHKNKAPAKASRPSLLRAISKIFLKRFIAVGLMAFIEECIIKIAQPIALGFLIRYFTNRDTYEDSYGYLSATGVTVCAGLLTFFHHPYFFGVCHIGMQVRVGCCSLIYRKAMRLSQASLQKTAIGQMVNLLSNDVNRFDQVTVFLHYLWIGPVQTAIIVGILWYYYGSSCIVGLVILVLFVPFQGYLGSKFSKLRDQTATRTDTRVRYMNEVVSGIRVIKMYSWESPFSSLVGESRADEIMYIKKTANLRALNMTLFFTSSKIIIFLTLLTFVLVNHENELSAELVFVTVALYNNVRLVMTLFYPNAVAQYAETKVSLRRLEDFLLLDEREDTYKFDSIGPAGDSASGSKYGVVMNDVTAKWLPDQGENTLENIRLTVHTGKVLAIIGPVGSGKGSILHTILKELPVLSGTIEVTGSTAYAAQEPWLFSGSVRENILLGKPYMEGWYQQVIKACALEHDLQLLPHGDSTLVGERGALLSGGQKARVTLARATYADSDIYLLDDPLSAVDAEVGKHLFNKCIKGLLSTKATILVTHQLQFVNQCDYIIIMEDGSIQAEGTYADLDRMGINFDKMTQNFQQNKTKLSSAGANPGSPVASYSGAYNPIARVRSASLSSKNSSRGASLHSGQSPVKYAPVGLLNISKEFISSDKEASYSGLKYVQNNADLETMDGFLPTNVAADTKLANSVSTDDGPEEEEEKVNVGSVKFALYCQYFRAGSNCCSFFMLVLMNIICQVFYTGSDYWLNIWANAEELKHKKDKSKLIYDDKNRYGILYYIYNDRTVQVYGYSIIVGLLFVTSFIRTLMFFWICMKSSTNLHKTMFSGIIRAPIQFFESNPSGRILNRFSKDMGQIDDALPPTFFDAVGIFLNVLAIIAIIAVINPYLLIPSFLLSVILYMLRKFYLRTARSVKRLEGTTRSPVFSHLTTSLYGLSTIRAFGCEREFIHQFDSHQDLHSSAWYLFLASTRWFGIRLDAVSVFYIGAVTYSFMFMTANGAGVGLAVSNAIMLSGMFQWGVRQSAEVQNQMVSVERVIEYTNLKPEAALKSAEDKKPPQEWPKKGEITFDHLYVFYGTNPVLKDICCSVHGGEKIGIVGRTGAGKSTFITVLFRMAEPVGSIIIDGVDISQIGLYDLRSKISIIPQEPVLFSGTLRKNVDPFGVYSDADVWAALEESHLAKDVKQQPKGLEAEVSEGGSNYSVGQRQLLCLARAILRKNKILVLDEATANVDLQTDSIIQQTIRTKFKKCTVLTVAHRLHTVMDCDRILVLDAGQVMEFDQPYVLLQNKDGHLRHLVNNTGKDTAQELTRVAAIAHKGREAENSTLTS